MASPVLAWRTFLGGGPTGPRALDVDLDGREEIVAMEAGVVSARSWSGKVIWKTAPLGVVSLSAVADVTGDSAPEIICRTANGVVVLSALTGSTIWHSPLGLTPILAMVGVTDFDGDGVPDIAIADRGGYLSDAPGHVYVYRLIGGQAVESLKTPSKSPAGDLLGADSIRLVDVDGDGLPDVLRPVHKSLQQGTVYAWSGKTGALLGQTDELDRVDCGAAVALAAKSKAPPLVVCTASAAHGLNEVSLRGAWGLRLEGKKLVRQWKYVVADESADRFEAFHVADVDGDGLAEIFASELHQGAWLLVALDAATGEPIAKIDGPKASPGQLHVRGVGLFRLHELAPVTVRALASVGPIDALDVQSLLMRWTRQDGFKPLVTLGQGPAKMVHSPSAGPPESVPLAGTLGTQVAESADFLLSQDTDKDQRVDQIVRVRVGASGAPLAQAKRTYPLPPEILSWVDDGGQRVALITTPDGQAALVDAALQTLNDADGDKLADLVYGGAQQPYLVTGRSASKGGQARVVAGLAGRLLVLDPAKAGPLASPKVVLTRYGGGAMRGNVTDLDGDGVSELLVRHRPAGGTATVEAFAMDGTAKWSWNNGGSGQYFEQSHGESLLLTDVDGDGGADVLVGYRAAGGLPHAAGQYALLRGANGQSLWGAGATCRDIYAASPIALDTSDKEPVAVGSYWVWRVRCRLSDGVKLSQVEKPALTGGLPILTDLDGKPGHELLLAGAFKGFGAEGLPDFKTLWSAIGKLWSTRPAALAFDKGVTAVVTLQHDDPLLQSRDAASGKLLWERRYVAGVAHDKAPVGGALPTLGGLISLADLAGDGKPGVIFHGSDGWLYGVSANDGGLRWALSFGGAVGDPIVADLDGDGELELLVAAPDGYLHAYDSDVLGAVPWVRENAGKGPALTDAEDIDQQEDGSTLHLNWAPMPGAQGYAVEVARADGGVIVPLHNVGASNAVSLQGLNLQPNVTYVSTVRGWSDTDKARKYSLPTTSDGLQLVDTSPPLIADFRAEPPAVPWSEPETTLRAGLSDATRLVRVRLELRPLAGGGPLHVVNLDKVTTSWELSYPWILRDDLGQTLPAGRYLATLRVFDLADHEASAVTEVVLCAVDQVVSNGGCADPTPARADGIVGDGAGNGIPAVQSASEGDATGCGCHAAHPGGAPDGWLILLTALLLAGLRFGPRRRLPAGSAAARRSDDG